MKRVNLIFFLFLLDPAPPAPPIAASAPGPSQISAESVATNASTDNKTTNKQDTSLDHEPDSDRANLMSAIREAGGIKTLKPSKQREIRKKEQKKSESQPQDLMSSLNSLLNLRRKAVADKREANGVEDDEWDD